MSFFVIADASEDSQTLSTPVFECGKDSKESAVAVFLSAASADEYLDAAGWTHDQRKAELEPTQLLKWLFVSHSDGIGYIMVDPDRHQQLHGEPQLSLELAEPFEAHAELLLMLSQRLSAKPEHLGQTN